MAQWYQIKQFRTKNFRVVLDCEPEQCPETPRSQAMNKHTVAMLNRLHDAGISTDDALALRRIAMTLQRWFELECGTGDSNWTHSIEREGDEDDSPPYMRHQGWSGGKFIDQRHRIQDRENGARKRLAKIMARYDGLEGRPILAAYVQTDPRGASLYILRQEDMKNNGEGVHCNYTRGIAVFK